MDENKIQNNNASKNIKTIHTYTSDMADAIRENETSVIKIALAEKEKRDREELYRQASGTGTSKFFLALGGVVLIGLAVLGWYFLSKKSDTSIAPQQVTKDTEALISYDEKAYIDVTENKNQNDLLDSLKSEIDRPLKTGSIKALFLTENKNKEQKLLSLKNLLFIMNTQIPAPLARTLDDNFMIGTYGGEDKTHLFLIFKIKDYNQAYPAMLEWEKTILSDIFVLFRTDISGERSNLFEKPWKDIIIDNKDARILYDKNGEDILYYIFADKNNLIITDSKQSIKEISLRLLSKSTKPL